MGNRPSSFAFIKNVYKDNPKTRITFLIDRLEEIDEQQFQDLKLKVVRLDFNRPKQKINRVTIGDSAIEKCDRIISFEPEPRNYGRLIALQSMFKGKRKNKKIEVFLQVDDLRMREMVEPKMNRLESFDIHYFKIEDLLVKGLLESSKFTILAPQVMQESWLGKDFKSAEEIGRALGSYRLLLVGFSSISESFITQVSNLLTLNPYQRLQITIVAGKAKDKVADFMDNKRELAKVFDCQVLPIPNSSHLLQEEVLKEHVKQTFSAVLFGHDDIKKNIFNLDKLADVMTDVPFAVYAQELMEIVPVIESLAIRHGNITVFGDRDNLLTKQVILEESLLNSAKRFNAKYNATMSELTGYPQDDRSPLAQWVSLSSVKKDSSAFQTAHRPTKRLILEKMLELYPDCATIEELIEKWQIELTDKTVSQQVDAIEKNPFLNYMTALEHQRWNNFYYMRNFVFGEEKDEVRKTHDCLIDDWSQFLASKQRDKAIFDTISTLDLKED